MESRKELDKIINEYKVLVQKYNEALNKLSEFLKESKQKTKTK